MPQALTYPGVYVQEVPSGVRSITGVATSVAAFVGYTRKGTPDKATTITSFSDFERSFGGLDRDSPVSYAVRQFFANGGTQAIIVRVAIGTTAAGWTLDDATVPVLDVFAANPGAWGNTLRIAVELSGVRNGDGDFNLVVSRASAGGGPESVIETHRNLSMDPASAQFVEAVVNNASTNVRAVRREAGVVYDQAGFAVSAAVNSSVAGSTGALKGTVDGDAMFALELTGGPWGTMTALVAATNAAILGASLETRLKATESDGSGNSSGTGSLKLSSLQLGQSSSVVIASGTLGSLSANLGMGLANGGHEFPGAAQHRPVAMASATRLFSGADGARGTAVDLLGNNLSKTGIYALLDVELFNILAIPETFDMTGKQELGVIPFAMALCEEKRAFYIVDMPSNRILADASEWANAAGSSRNAATYFPPVRILDPLDGLRPRAMAPSGTLAGVFARTDAQRGVWKAPAGTEATLNGVLDLTQPVNDAENGQLNPLGINVLRNFSSYGRVAWGARTMRGSDAQADEYKYIPVRRLALFLEESLYRGTQWVVFEPNDEPLWSQIRLNLGSFMQGLFRQGAFQGKSPREAYFVKCDKETTTQADINLGIVNIQVGFAPLKPAEFVVIHVQQIAGDIQT